MTTTKYIETITFDEIINQALDQKNLLLEIFLTNLNNMAQNIIITLY